MAREDEFSADDADEQDYKLYLTADGRKTLGISEFVLATRLPQPGSECIKLLSEILGEEVVFRTEKAISAPWLVLTRRYRAARDGYHDATRPYVPAADDKTRELQSIEFTKETVGARTILGQETDKAIAAVKVLAEFLAQSKK